MTDVNIREVDKDALRFILSNFSYFGDEVKEMVEGSPFTSSQLIAVAKRYEGRKFKGGEIVYVPPSQGSWKQSLPGIKNPRTGICEQTPATIAVIKRRKQRKRLR